MSTKLATKTVARRNLGTGNSRLPRRESWRFAMQKGLTRDRCVSFSLLLGLALVSLLLVTPSSLQASYGEQMITFSGQRISSIFDGLSPSRFARYSAPARSRSPKMSGLLEERSLDLHLVAHLVLAQCGQCTPTACFGSFERQTDCYGCCTDPVACPSPLHNYKTDSKNNKPSDQVQDEPCGPECCDDFYNCD